MAEELSHENRVQNKVVRCSILHKLEFDDLVDIVAFDLKDRPPEKCNGLARGQINNMVNQFMGQGGRRGLDEAIDAIEGEAVPDHVLDFVVEQLGFLYPELKKASEARENKGEDKTMEAAAADADEEPAKAAEAAVKTGKEADSESDFGAEKEADPELSKNASEDDSTKTPEGA